MQKILVVDDEELNREILYNILKDNYIVETAEDGEKALEKLRKYHEWQRCFWIYRCPISTDLQ